MNVFLMILGLLLVGTTLTAMSLAIARALSPLYFDWKLELMRCAALGYGAVALCAGCIGGVYLFAMGLG